MSSIPSSAMKHAHAHHDEEASPPQATEPSASSDERPQTPAGTALDDATGAVLDAIKTHPKTAVAVGATVVAGVAAAIAAPFIGAKAKPAAKPKKAAAKRKPSKKSA